MLFLSTGPGALTALGALQEAYATGVPLLVDHEPDPAPRTRRRPQGPAAPARRPAAERAATSRSRPRSCARRRRSRRRSPTPGRSPRRLRPVPPGSRSPRTCCSSATARAAGAVGDHVDPRADAARPSSSTRRPRCSRAPSARSILAGGGVRRSQGGRAALRAARRGARRPRRRRPWAARARSRSTHPLSAAVLDRGPPHDRSARAGRRAARRRHRDRRGHEQLLHVRAARPAHPGRRRGPRARLEPPGPRHPRRRGARAGGHRRPAAGTAGRARSARPDAAAAAAVGAGSRPPPRRRRGRASPPRTSRPSSRSSPTSAPPCPPTPTPSGT